MSKHHRDPNDPLQDFVDMQEHRYEPGYWPTEWIKRGRLAPFDESVRKAHLSSFYRALALTGLIGMFPLGVIGALRDELPYPWLWGLLMLASLFFGLWYFIHRAMTRNAARGEPSETRATSHKHH